MNSSRRRALAATCLSVIVAVVTVAFAAPSDAHANQKTCRVKNPTQDTWFATNSGLALTRAIGAAHAGDRLNVFGTCRGSFRPTVSLTIAGSHSATHPTTLRGTDSGYIVDSVPATTIRLTRLTLRGGTAGGISAPEGAIVTLSHSKVVGNSTTRPGAGILNGGNLTINSSRIVRNHSDSDGGGIFNYGKLVVNDSAINCNQAPNAGGLFNEGSAVLNRSRVRFNIGGGIQNVNSLILNDTVVSDNTPYDM